MIIGPYNGPKINLSYYQFLCQKIQFLELFLHYK